MAASSSMAGEMTSGSVKGPLPAGEGSCQLTNSALMASEGMMAGRPPVQPPCGERNVDENLSLLAS